MIGITEIKTAIIVLVSSIAAIFYFKKTAKNDAISEEKQKQTEEFLKNVNETKDIDANIDSLPDDVVSKRLHFWERDKNNK